VLSFGLEVVIGPAVALASSLGVLGAQCCVALQFGGEGELLRTLVAIAFGLLGVVQHEPAVRVALTDATSVTRRLSRTVW
jgi:hypothetical protein